MIGLISASILLSAAFLSWQWQRSAATIQKTTMDSRKLLQTTNQSITTIKSQKAAAAQQTADKTITSGTSAASVDSKSCNNDTTHADPTSIDVIVNKKHCIQPVTYAPTDLVTVRGATLSAKAIDSFSALMAAADAAGQPLSVTSSYRSYQDQVATYNYWVGVSGASGADSYSARPGYSEHQTGFAFDVADADKQFVLSDFIKTPQYQWLQDHAAEFGFIQRYYAGEESVTGYGAEEWHYRYVGTAVAEDMKAKNIKTLEQYWHISGGGY